MKHGLYSTVMTPDEKARFEAAYVELRTDPAAALLADAAVIRAKVESILARAAASPDGMLIVGQHLTKVTSEGVRADGMPTASSTSTTMGQQRVDVLGPVADALGRSARLVDSAMAIRRDPPPLGADEVLDELTEAQAGDILKEIFNDRGALPAHETVIDAEVVEKPGDGG